MKDHKVYINDKQLYQLMISDVRYAFPRDNGLASGTSIDIITKYLPKMSKEFQDITAKQLIEEIIYNLRAPGINGGRKHKCKLYIPEHDSYRILYISDYEYERKKLLSEAVYKFENLEVDPNIVFEDEDDWRGLITFLSKYVDSKTWCPYNDKEHRFYKVIENE